MNTRKIILGPRELTLLFTLEKEGSSVFTFTQAQRILETTTPSVKNVLLRLRRKGRIEEIEKGKYLLVPHLIDPSYIGFWSALNYYGMTEQTPRVVFVVTVKRKRDLEYGPTKFEFVTLSRKKFFGFVEERAAGGKFNISSREKTVVDCLLYPRYCGGIDEAVKGLWNARRELDFAKVLEFSKRLGVNVVMRRLGYILELLRIEKDVSAEIASGKFRGFMWLDPLGPKKALEYSAKYGVMINRTEKELTGWMGH